MIKITRFFYLHILTLPLLILSAVAGVLHTTLMAYCVVTVHELFHLFASILLRERVKSIIIMPFGMTLRLSGALIKQPIKEILIALAGPFANAFMLMVGLIFRRYYIWAEGSMFFYNALNWTIMLLNLLPVLPLDGGRALRAAVAHFMGYLAAMKIMRSITRVVLILLIGAGIILFLLLKGNFSLLMIAAFLIFHMTEEKKKNDLFVLKELVRSKEKLIQHRMMSTKIVSAEENVRAKSMLSRSGYDSYFLIYLVNAQGYGRLISEAQLVEALLENGYGVRLKEIAP